MTWLRHRVPITLLADLAARGGPLSRDIFTSEAIEYDFLASVPQPRQGSSQLDRNGYSRAPGA
jgi:hypothetical protein